MRALRAASVAAAGLFRMGTATAVLPALLVMLIFGSQSAHAASGVLSAQDKACLKCHGTAGLGKKLAGGETLSLHVDGKAFAGSVHQGLGCSACHANIALKSHSQTRRAIPSTRAYTVAQAEVCRACHQEKAQQYDGSIHASLLREGNPIAPVCTDCHSPHEARPRAARESIADVPCRKCHSSIFDAYAASVHGVARAKPDKNNAPLCADCHRAHEISAASTAEQPRNACLGCHGNTLRAHRDWLPNAERHLDAISCAACHAPLAKRKVDLRLYDRIAQKRVAEKQGVPQFESLVRSADAKGAGLDAMALQSLLKEFNREGTDQETTLRGRLEVSTGVEAHQLQGKDQAIHDCAACHKQGAAPFQSVTVSIVGADGRPLRHGAQQEVLNSAISIDSVGGFYALGGTRIKLLDWLLALALLGGIAVPAGHQTLRWLLSRYARKIRAEETRRAQAQSQSTPVSGAPE